MECVGAGVGVGATARSLVFAFALLSAFVFGTTIACLAEPVFECLNDEQCSDLGEGALCEAVGFCSYPDDRCTSMRRFHRRAGEGLADECTDRTCGDGTIDEGEQCDDGNDQDGDGCNRNCLSSGQEIWTRTYASPGFVPDRAYSLAIDSQGNIAVIGHVTVEGQGANLWIRRFSSTGEVDWTWVLDGGANADEEGWSILVDANDEFFVAGYVATVDANQNAWFGKLSTDGFLIWDAQYDGGVAAVDQTRGITFAPDGDLVAVGYVTPATTTDTNLWLQRRSNDGQTVRWTQVRDGLPPGKPDRGHSIVPVSTDFIAVGYKQDQDDRQYYWIERFDAQGDAVWTDEGVIGGPQGVWTAVTVVNDGSVLLTGWREASAGDSDAWLQRRDPGGAILWEEIVPSPGGADDRANVVIPTSDGGFVVGGELGAGAGSTDAWIRRYAADNTEVWTDTISGPAGERDTIWGLGFGPDGNLVVCGYISSPATSWDIWVRKYTP